MPVGLLEVDLRSEGRALKEGDNVGHVERRSGGGRARSCNLARGSKDGLNDRRGRSGCVGRNVGVNLGVDRGGCGGVRASAASLAVLTGLTLL